MSLLPRRELAWRDTPTRIATATQGGQMLSLIAVQLPEGAWSVTALETNQVAMLGGVAGVLDDHGHEWLGEHATWEAAADAATTYVERWRGEGPKKCDCGPILSKNDLHLQRIQKFYDEAMPSAGIVVVRRR